MLVKIIALWAITAPSGYVIGKLAADHFGSDFGSEKVAIPWLCAFLPPLSAMLAMALIFKEETK